MNAIVMLRQAPAKPVAVVAPKFSLEMNKDGWDLTVVVELADGMNNEYRLNYSYDCTPEGYYIDMDDTCELAVIDCEAETKSVSEIKTPDWIDVHVAPEVSSYLQESAYDDYINTYEY